MGKNRSAKECNLCGELVYYGGNCSCQQEGGYEEYLIMMDEKRHEAEEYILEMYNRIAQNNAASCDVPFEEVLNIAQDDLGFHAAIWYASTEILPNLEVQVVIDSNNKCHVSTGSSGYVDFTINPVGMKLPIRCWIHTHPFGAAYFSSTDWRTVNTWLPLMETAYVLGASEGHYGFWTQSKPNELEIITGENIDIQIQNRGEEE
jgi:hypothetical protein